MLRPFTQTSIHGGGTLDFEDFKHQFTNTIFLILLMATWIRGYTGDSMCPSQRDFNPEISTLPAIVIWRKPFCRLIDVQLLSGLLSPSLFSFFLAHSWSEFQELSVPPDLFPLSSKKEKNSLHSYVEPLWSLGLALSPCFLTSDKDEDEGKR